MSRYGRSGIPPLSQLENKFDEIGEEFQILINTPFNKIPTDAINLNNLHFKISNLTKKFASLYQRLFESLLKNGLTNQLETLKASRKTIQLDYEEFQKVLNFKLEAVRLPVLPDLDISFQSGKSLEHELEGSSHFERQSSPESSIHDSSEYRSVNVTANLDQISCSLGRFKLQEHIMSEPVTSQVETSMPQPLSSSPIVKPQIGHIMPFNSVSSQGAERIIAKDCAESLHQVNKLNTEVQYIPQSQTNLISNNLPSIGSQENELIPQGIYNPFYPKSISRQGDTQSLTQIPSLGNDALEYIRNQPDPRANMSSSDSTKDFNTNPPKIHLTPSRLDVPMSRNPTYLGVPSLNDFSVGPSSQENMNLFSTPGATGLVTSTKPDDITDLYPRFLQDDPSQGPSAPGYPRTSYSVAPNQVYGNKSVFNTGSHSKPVSTKLPTNSLGVGVQFRNTPTIIDSQIRDGSSNRPEGSSPTSNRPDGLIITSRPTNLTGFPTRGLTQSRVEREPIKLCTSGQSVKPKAFSMPDTSCQPPFTSTAREAANIGFHSEPYESSMNFIDQDSIQHSTSHVKCPPFPPSYQLGSSNHAKNQEMPMKKFLGDSNPQLEFPPSNISYLLPPPPGFSSNEPTVAKNVLSSSMVGGNVERKRAFLPAHSGTHADSGREYNALLEDGSTIPRDSGYFLPRTKLQLPSSSYPPFLSGEGHSGVGVGNADSYQVPYHPPRDTLVSSTSTGGLFIPRPPTYSPKNVDSNKKFFESLLSQPNAKNNHQPSDEVIYKDSGNSHQNIPNVPQPNIPYAYPPVVNGSSPTYYPCPPMVNGSYPISYPYPPMINGSYPPYYPPFYPPYPYPYQPHPQTNTQFEALTNHLIEAELVKTSMEKFDGKAHKFQSWWAKLEGHIRNLKLSPQKLLLVLESHVSGEPKRFISNKISSSGQMTMEDVDRLIQEMANRYGSPTQISKELNQLIAEFRPITERNQSEQLYHLADLCNLILHNQPKCVQLNYFDCPEGIEPIRGKLPIHIQGSWAARGHSYTQEYGVHPPFSFFVDFLKRQADLYSDESFRIIPQIPASSTSRKQVKVLATKLQSPTVTKKKESTSKKTLYCLHHKAEGHNITDCKDINQMGHENFFKRRKRIRELGLCQRCLGKHSVDNCRVKVVCNVCEKAHATILHVYRKLSNPPEEKLTDSPNTKKDDSSTYEEDPSSNTNRNPIPSPLVMCTKLPESRDSVSCSKTLLVEITMSQVPDKSMLAHAIIDEQCNTTLVDTRVLDHFELDFPSADFSIKFATQDCEMKTSGKYVTGLQVKGMLADEIIPIPEALSRSNLADTTQEVASPEMVRDHRLISQFAKYFPELQPDIPVLLIIGRNCGRAMATECLTTVEPYVHKTPLGYSLVGNIDGVQSSNNEVRVFCTALERDNPVEVKYNFTKKSAENFDTYATYPDDEHPGLSYEDKLFMSEMVSKINVNAKNNIELPLPLKTTELPQNKGQVFQRTKKTLQNLQKDPEKLQQCLQSVEKNIQKKYIEPVPPDEVENPPYQTWYLPIFPVEHKNKAPRLVYDASAKYHGISLNDALLQGPDMNNQLRSVLLRFREQPIAFAADIEAMFNNFAVPTDQKDLLRFYWFDKNDPSKDLVPYRSTSHIFGCVSSPAVSNCGLKYCADQLPDGDEAKTYLDKNFYVDDGLHSTNSSVSAIEVLSKTMSLLKTYNMKLHKIISNSQEVLDAFPGAVKTTSITTLPSEGDGTAALGVQWNTENDNFLLIPNLPSRPFSKRGILSTINSLFDPIGIASPVILYGRIMQRHILHNHPLLEKYGWDDLLPSPYFGPWSNWLNSLDQLSKFQIPRGFYPEGFIPIRQELHVFSDASEHAIGHVNYLRSIDHAGTCHVSFVSASSKLAPKAATTMPRLELNAAVEASKNANKIMTDLRHKPNAVYFHSDSQIVLGYLNNQKRRFSKYIERRINVIHNLFPAAHWFYIGSKENPADHASRPSTPEEILSSNWLRGPSLLWDSSYDPDVNPVQDSLPTTLPEEEYEVSVLSTQVTHPSPFSNLFSKINSLPKLVNVFIIILRFGRILDKIREKKGCLENPRPMEVSPQEAKTALIKVVQAECFSEEIKKLKSGTHLSDTHQLSNLAPSVDRNGLLRVGGRLKHSDIDFSVKYPILIPQDHPLSSTIIQYFHSLNKHQGSLITHNAIIQNGYHIQNGRTHIRNFLKSCVTCRKLRGKTSEQIMADFPPDRLVENVPPFSNVGMDVFGPFYIHDGKSTRANSGTKKIWALIIVCLPSRAIHLEYLNGLDTSSLRNAFNRFRAIRGPCLTIRSDRGTNFVSARKQMEAVDFSSFSKELQAEGIQWKFNSPYASHQGGCWERRIGSVRRVLEAILKLISDRGISRDEFITFLAEAASVVNNTPLWTPSNDPNDPSPLTPQMLLTLRRADEFHILDDYTPEDILSYGPRRYRRVQYLASQFWQRWRTEYLHTLTTRQKWKKPSPCIQEGDLVLIKDKNLARNHWPMAMVRSTEPSSDGLIRKVTLTLPPLPGRTAMRSLDRAIQDLVLLIPREPLK